MRFSQYLEAQAIETQQISAGLADAPEITGLTFRHFRGDADYPIILKLNTESKIADNLGHDLHTLESITHAYGSTRNHDPGKDVLIAEVNGEAVGFVRVFLERELDGTRVYNYYAFMLPEWRGKGIEFALLHWAENRAREMNATEPPVAPAFLSTSAYSTMGWLEKALDAEGYTPARFEFHMETPDLNNIPEAAMPEGLEIRPARPEHYRAIMEANAEAFRDHWGAGETDDHDIDIWLNDPMTQPELWVVAWDGDQVAGSILNYINQEFNKREGRKLGYTESISVRRPWRRQGLARAMLSHSMKMHRDLGMEQTALGVDTQNPSGALKLYQSMGYQEKGRSTIYRKPL